VSKRGIQINTNPVSGNNCDATGDYFNPTGTLYGEADGNANNRAVGNLGNI